MMTPLDTVGKTLDCLCFGYEGDCVCGDGERALRHIIDGNIIFAGDEREWALDEIASVEGYRREDFQDGTDAEVAKGVLSAWADWCQDKGLI